MEEAMAKATVCPVATEVRELFELMQSRQKNDVFLDFLLSNSAHLEGNQTHDNWRFQREIITMVLYVFFPNQKFIGRMLSPSIKKGISQPAVNKRLVKAVEIIAKRYGCPKQALYQELSDARSRIVNSRDMRRSGIES
jgi:hypothetical protein